MAISNLHIEAVRVGFSRKEELPGPDNIIKYALFTDYLEFYMPGKHKHLQSYRSPNDERRHKSEIKRREEFHGRQDSPDESPNLRHIDAERFIKFLIVDSALQNIQTENPLSPIPEDFIGFIAERFLYGD